MVVVHSEAARAYSKYLEERPEITAYGMAPFWREEIPGKSQTARRGLLRCTVDEAELERIRRYSQELGYRCEGAFALDCIRYVMEQGDTPHKD